MHSEATRHGMSGPSPGWRWTLVAAVVLLAVFPGLARGANVTLAWDANTETVAGYHLYRGLSSGAYNPTPTVVANVVTNGVVTATVDGLSPCLTYYFAVTAYDAKGESGYSNEVSYMPPCIPAPETVSQPSPPAGPTDLQAGTPYVFTARGAASSAGDPVQYRFFWSDGTDSDWLPVGVIEATKSWDVAATYTDVRVQARCAAHTSVVSALSDPIAVTVAAAPAETIAAPAAPDGPTTVTGTQPHSYATGGSLSSAGHPVQYRFLWADGTVSPWLAAGASSADKSWLLPGTYAVRSEARCVLHPGVHSSPSPPLEVTVATAPGETVSPPAPPQGPGDGLTGVVYGYTAGNAASSTGDPVQYRLQWGDGTASPWLTPGGSGAVAAWKSWPAEGVYFVSAEARCALHPSVPAVSGPTAVSIAGGASLLLADSFSDGTAAGDPQWRTLSGKWLVGADRTFTSGSMTLVNRAVVSALPAFAAGRIVTKLRLSARSLANRTGILFAVTDAQHYRYVALRDSRVVIGQAGDSPGEKAGIKASAARRLRADQWYQLRADIHPGGRVAVFFGRETRPVVTYRFGDATAGGIGCLAEKSVAHFDDYRAWDARALP
ncbi:MAG TPA: fibronectin type III domain-containing protein [bacterium]